MRPQHDTIPDDPVGPDPETDVPGEGQRGFREEPTSPAETRTVRLGTYAPWLAVPETPRERRRRDPFLVPAILFLMVLTSAIGFTLLSGPKKAPTQSLAP